MLAFSVEAGAGKIWVAVEDQATTGVRAFCLKTKVGFRWSWVCVKGQPLPRNVQDQVTTQLQKNKQIERRGCLIDSVNFLCVKWNQCLQKMSASHTIVREGLWIVKLLLLTHKQAVWLSQGHIDPSSSLRHYNLTSVSDNGWVSKVYRASSHFPSFIHCSG